MTRDSAFMQGAIQLDEIQQDYLYALLGTTSAAARHDETQAMSSAASTSQGPPPPGMVVASHPVLT